MNECRLWLIYTDNIQVTTCLVAKSYPTLCNSMDCSPPGSSVHGISQARILEWVAIPFSEDLPDPGVDSVSPALAGRFFTPEPPGKPEWGSGDQVIAGEQEKADLEGDVQVESRRGSRNEGGVLDEKARDGSLAGVF